MDLPALLKQHQLLLVRKCIQHKLSHLQRTIEHAHVAEAAAQLEGRVQGAVQRIMDVGEGQMPHTAKLQMSLPMRHGGMGLIKLTLEVSQASYLTYAAQKHAVLREVAQPLPFFEDARGEQLQQQWSALVSAVDGVPDSEQFIDAAACLWTEEQRALTEEVTAKTMPLVQRLVNRHQETAQRERLMAMFDVNNPHSLEGAQAVARVRSCSGGALSAYLEVPQLTHKLRMANSHLTWELRFHNGIQIFPADNAGKRCPCGDMLRGMRDADHALTCPKYSSVCTLRHDYLNKVWCDAARCAGVASAVESLHWSESCARCKCSQCTPPRRRGRRRIVGHAGTHAGD